MKKGFNTKTIVMVIIGAVIAVISWIIFKLFKK